jgi:hypothetical protein
MAKGENRKRQKTKKNLGKPISEGAVSPCEIVGIQLSSFRCDVVVKSRPYRRFF